MMIDGMRVGPRRPMPFPTTGEQYQLMQCPTCKMKGMLFFYAPYEHAYPTRCIKCKAMHVVKRNDKTLREIQKGGGFTPLAQGIRSSQRWGMDATQFYDKKRELQDAGLKSAHSQGLVPRSVDTPLGVKSGF